MSKYDIETSHGGDDSSFQRNVASFTSHAEEIVDDRDYVSSVNERTYECNSNSYSNNHTSSQPTSLGLNALVSSQVAISDSRRVARSN